MEPFIQSVITTTLPCWVIGHRGAAAVCPENTLISFNNARDSGACMIEFDVQQSTDGELVVFHDETLERLCSEPTTIASQSWRELAPKVVGHWRDESLTMPRLADVFMLFQRSLLYNIELKTNIVHYPGIEERLVTLVHDHDIAERVLVSSFQPESLRLVREKDPSIALGFLIDLVEGARGKSPDLLIQRAQEYDCFSLHPDFRLLRLYPTLAEKFHEA
jgi:glycerophosphoryl diester phosphodiesterase